MVDRLEILGDALMGFNLVKVVNKGLCAGALVGSAELKSKSNSVIRLRCRFRSLGEQ